jgi:hypothetical protein
MFTRIHPNDIDTIAFPVRDNYGNNYLLERPWTWVNGVWKDSAAQVKSIWMGNNASSVEWAADTLAFLSGGTRYWNIARGPQTNSSPASISGLQGLKVWPVNGSFRVLTWKSNQIWVGRVSTNADTLLSTTLPSGSVVQAAGFWKNGSSRKYVGGLKGSVSLQA